MPIKKKGLPLVLAPWGKQTGIRELAEEGRGSPSRGLCGSWSHRTLPAPPFSDLTTEVTWPAQTSNLLSGGARIST